MKKINSDKVKKILKSLRDFAVKKKYFLAAAAALLAAVIVILLFSSCQSTSSEGGQANESEAASEEESSKGGLFSFFSKKSDEESEESEETQEEDPVILAYNADTKEGYMNNCVFLGDSRTVAAVNYGFISDDSAFAQVGISHMAVSKATITNNSGVEYTLESYLSSHQLPVTYVCYGVNGMAGISEEDYESSYSDLVDEIISLDPDTHVVLMSIWPVDDNGRYKNSCQNSWIEKYNEFLLNMATEKGLHYLNVNEVLTDSDGQMKSEFNAGDGLHYAPVAYNDIIDYIIHHPVPGVSDDGDYEVKYVKPNATYTNIVKNGTDTTTEDATAAAAAQEALKKAAEEKAKQEAEEAEKARIAAQEEAARKAAEEEAERKAAEEEAARKAAEEAAAEAAKAAQTVTEASASESTSGETSAAEETKEEETIIEETNEDTAEDETEDVLVVDETADEPIDE